MRKAWQKMSPVKCKVAELGGQFSGVKWHNRAVEALANKIAQIAWAVRKHERQFGSELAAV